MTRAMESRFYLDWDRPADNLEVDGRPIAGVLRSAGEFAATKVLRKPGAWRLC